MPFRLQTLWHRMDGRLQDKQINWRWAAASAIGTAHIHSQTRLQDAYAVQSIDGVGMLAILADGAGSAEFGAQGAWMVCRYLVLQFRQWFEEQKELPTDETLLQWIGDLRGKISTSAEVRGTDSRQFAATLAVIVITSDAIITLQVGDSAIVARNNGEWDVLCWPENGEYASTTYFITEEPEPRLTISREERIHDGFALFSDGIGELALSFADRSAYAQFLDPMMRPVDALQTSGRDRDLSQKLQLFLESPRVCDRTDDDKTLILISGK